jgi:PAS domain S-box-containing protein
MKSVTSKIVIIYFLAGLLWISLSDILFVVIEGKKDHPILVMGSISAALFLIATGFVLHKLISLHFSQLQESEKQYRGYFQDNPTPMWLYNRKTLKFTDVNNAAINSYGFNKDEFLKMSILDIRPPEDHEKVMIAVEAFEDDYKNSGVWTHKRKNGSKFFVQVTSHLSYLHNGVHVMVMAKDITQRMRAEMQLQQVNKDLVRQNNVLKEISWAESHNVRRPLSSILGLLDVLRICTSEQEKELCINYIEISAAELDIMIHNISDLLNDAVTIEDDIKQRSMAVDAMLQ